MVSSGGASRFSSELALRVMTGSIFGLLSLFSVWYGGKIFWCSIMLLGVLSLFEWYSITKIERRDQTGLGKFALPISFLLIIGIVMAWGGFFYALAIYLLAALTIFFIEGTFLASLGLLYVAGGMLSLLFLREDVIYGFESLLYLLLIVWATDVGAFLGGRTIGGAKICPAISPGKTWAGFFSGLSSALLVGFLFSWATGYLSSKLLLVSLGLSLVTQGGDLFESAVKRNFGVKDSGAILPGHGGVLDRIDGLIFAAISAVIIGFIHAGSQVSFGLLIW